MLYFCISPQYWLTFWRKLWPIYPTLPQSASSHRLDTKVSWKKSNTFLFLFLDNLVKRKQPKGTLGRKIDSLYLKDKCNLCSFMKNKIKIDFSFWYKKYTENTGTLSTVDVVFFYWGPLSMWLLIGICLYMYKCIYVHGEGGYSAVLKRQVYHQIQARIT